MTTITPQIASIQAVDAWISVINGNVGGLVRTGYKRTSPTFVGGGTLSETRTSGGAILPLQIPEASMRVTTAIDFSQGPVMGSTSPLHLALNGPGFFPVVPPNALDPVLYTRDGEFALQDLGGGRYALVNPQGLRLFLPGLPGLATTTSHDPALVDFYKLGPDERPLEIVVPPAPNQVLRFSAYGSTAFEKVPDAGALAIVPLNPANRPKFINGSTSLVPYSLEASNADINSLIPELSLAQKLFVALGKLIQAQNDRYDQIFQTIR